ncbi:MAG: hypothetical protein E7663_06930 [Ruminococcaceae bacterium]|nr:hypothetical protein [Oscillospiraceae bacterium]
MSRANTCIVAVGYNRPDAMGRLLNSLQRADYQGDRVDLVVSIDKGERQAEIVEIAERFGWEHGEKTVRAFPQRQGLKSHILQCGDYAFEYGAVVVLEDDITVSESFYNYVRQAVSFYSNDPRIGGISLYKHCMNVGVQHFFEPQYNGYDAFLMQYAQSWGECWTTKMWSGFREWIADKSEDYFDSGRVDRDLFPDNILSWGKHSWMKFFMAYLVEKDLYFVYPHHALSTNNAEVGQHNSIAVNDYQVALSLGNITYRFPAFAEAVKYDIFFERVDLSVPRYADRRVILDLYGNKKKFSDGDVLVSSTARPYAVLATWKLKYRPQEVNCLYPEEGTGLFVYDLHTPARRPDAFNRNIRTKYDIRAIPGKEILQMGLYALKTKILKKRR